MTTYVSYEQFQTDFPALADQDKYPASGFAFWQNMAVNLLKTDRFGPPNAVPPLSMYDMAMELFIAHNLVLEMQTTAAGSNGAPATGPSGPLVSKTVGPVSATYDVNAGIEEKAGHWNLTVYGTRFIRICKMFGAGPIQVGACGAAAGTLGFGGGTPGAYSGPYDSSGFF